MDSKSADKTWNKLNEKKLSKISKKIQKARKNTKLAEKEAAEFEEIHKLLESADDSETTPTEPFAKEVNYSDCSVIPLASFGLKVFHDELIFSLYQEKTCCLKNFISGEEKCTIFGKNKLIPEEKHFRKLIAYHVAENLMPDKGNCSSVNLYIFYLMSVHKDANFVAACFDFLKFQKFNLCPENVFLVFINFGIKCEDLYDFCDENLVKKFLEEKENIEEIGGNHEFPFFNLEMVGRILLQYITEDSLIINSNTKPLIRVLVKITLDPKIRTGSLLSLYTTILAVLCVKIHKLFSLEEILSWVHLKEEDLLTQIEICRNISRSIFPELHESLMLKLFSEILNSRISPARPPIKINHLKSVLGKLRNKELSPLKIYSLLQLVNCSLPGLTATVKDSAEINTLLASLEQKISRTDDSVDLIRLKLEIAKVGNLVSNGVNNRFSANETVRKSSAKKVKCSS